MAVVNESEGTNRRISVPNIPADAVRWYPAVNILTVYLAVTNTLFAAAKGNAVGWQAIQYIATGELLKAGGVAIIAAPIIVEVFRMVLAGMWTEQRLRRAKEQVQRRWEEWNKRREEAEAKGEPFIEPPPQLENRRNRPASSR